MTFLSYVDIRSERRFVQRRGGPRPEGREGCPGQQLAVLAGRALGFMFVGPLGRYRPIAAWVVGAAIVDTAKDAPPGVHVYESDRIRGLAATRN
jgi:hypothetical protein